MARGRPYLVFVSGPQTGQRVRLRSRPMEAGRLSSSDIKLTEDYVSRRQMRFRRRGDEWTVENLSANGTRINGRNYREGRQIILGTGDVIGVGSETSILYVGPEADADEVFAQWREDHEIDAAEQAEAETEEAPDQAEQAEETAESADAPVTGRLPTGPAVMRETPAEEPRDEEDTEAAERREKRKKYLVFAGIYAVAFIALMVVLGALRGGDEADPASGSPAALREQEITATIESPLRRQANPARAAEMLEKAELYYRDRHLLGGNLYKAVKCFKLHLAYSGRSDFAELRHSRMYRDAVLELSRQVHEQYEQAYRLERNGDWEAAETAFRRLQRIYPAAGEPEPRTTDAVMNPDGPIWRNIMLHLTYISRQGE